GQPRLHLHQRLLPSAPANACTSTPARAPTAPPTINTATRAAPATYGTHQPVERLVRQRIIGPLGLTRTTFPTRSPFVSGYRAHGYRQPTAPGAPFLDVTPF